MIKIENINFKILISEKFLITYIIKLEERNKKSNVLGNVILYLNIIAYYYLYQPIQAPNSYAAQAAPTQPKALDAIFYIPCYGLFLLGFSFNSSIETKGLETFTYSLSFQNSCR